MQVLMKGIDFIFVLMKFSVGDKVKFLDQVGEGTVVKILSDSLVMITDSDGFDYEVNASELIKTAGSSSERELYERALPSENQIFVKDVDEEKLKVVKDKFADIYKERVTIKDSEVMEVDLHIHELLDSTTGMRNGDMLDYQIKHFERMMKIAERKKFKRAVFIHGVGEGVLRAEIRRLIDEYYPNCSYRDGNPREYGVGATQVEIRYN